MKKLFIFLILITLIFISGCINYPDPENNRVFCSIVDGEDSCSQGHTCYDSISCPKGGVCGPQEGDLKCHKNCENDLDCNNINQKCEKVYLSKDDTEISNKFCINKDAGGINNIFSEKDCKNVEDPFNCKDFDRDGNACEENPNCYYFRRGGSCDCPNCLNIRYQCLPKEIDNKYFDDPLYCESDDDCVLVHAIGGSCCQFECPRFSINNDHLNKHQSEFDQYCNEQFPDGFACGAVPPTDPKICERGDKSFCINNKCTYVGFSP